MIPQRTDVVVIGGGAIGLAAAYYVAKAGANVTVLERGQLGQGCSFGNAGLIVPSYSIPLATHQRLFEAMAWVLRRGSPITLKPRASALLIDWLFLFAASCTSKKAAATTQLLSDLGRLSMELFNRIPGLRQECGFQQAGWLHLYRTEAGLAQAAEEAGRLQRSAIRSLVLTEHEIRELEPLAKRQLVGGIYYPDEAHLVPDRFNTLLAHLAAEQGARLNENVEVTSFEQEHGQVQAVLANGAKFRAGIYILAAGAWTPLLARGLGLRLPVEAARGYSLDFAAPSLPLRLPLLLGEAHVVATPMGDRGRITGAFELVGMKSRVDETRINAICDAPAEYLSNVGSLVHQSAWSGFRPASPDGIPFVGPTRRYPNLLLAAGHGTLGMTLSLVTGKLLADLVSHRPLPSGLLRLLPARVGL